MSRISDALARAADVAATAPQPDALSPDPAAALDQYVPELRRAAERRTVAAGTPHGVRTVAVVPVLDTPTFKPPSRDFAGRVLRASSDSSIPAAEYANLATVLHEAQLDRGLQTLLVTSATPQEGKTLTVVNLAMTLCDSYARRVLIVDADLRRPSVHRALGIEATAGLSDVLARPSTPLPLLQVTPMLTVLPAGGPLANPLTRLTPDRLQPLLAQCASRFDWVIVDTPPVGTGADAQLIARFVQGVIFVIRAGAAPFSAVERAIAELGRECILGIVLNGVDERAARSTPYGPFTPAR